MEGPPRPRRPRERERDQILAEPVMQLDLDDRAGARAVPIRVSRSPRAVRIWKLFGQKRLIIRHGRNNSVAARRLCAVQSGICRTKQRRRGSRVSGRFSDADRHRYVVDRRLSVGDHEVFNS